MLRRVLANCQHGWCLSFQSRARWGRFLFRLGLVFSFDAMARPLAMIRETPAIRPKVVWSFRISRANN